MIKKFSNIWEYFSEIGIHSTLAKRESRITRLINRFVFAIVLMVIASFIFQMGKHFLFRGEVKIHSFLMVVTFSPFMLAVILNNYHKYKLSRYTIIIYTLVNNLIWSFFNVGQACDVYYSNLILAIPIVIFFRKLKDQLALIILTFLFFAISYYVDINFEGIVISTMHSPRTNVIIFGICLYFSFLMMRFFLSEIATAEVELEKQNSDLEDFTRLASHDMKEPLRTIVSFSSLIKSKHSQDLPDEVVNYLEYIETGAGRLNNLLDGLSTYNQLSVPSLENLKEVDLENVTADLIDDLQASIKERKTEISYESLPKVLAVPAHMRQLFQNIISNAIKFQPHDINHVPSIQIRHITKDGNDVIIFKDNGIGIPKKNAPSVFQKFKRLHSRKDYDGTGLGLATCQKIVELYGGEISIESELEKGTSISVLLPRK